MVNSKHVKNLKKGVEKWNKWREENPQISPNLRGLNFVKEFPNENEIYNLPNFEGCNFSNVDLHGVSLRNGYYINCSFDGSTIQYADLVDAYFSSCSFKKTKMRVTKIGSATFYNCKFEDADLSYCSAEETSFSNSKLINTKLENIRFVSNDFSDANLVGCSIYGISSWDLNLNNSVQKDLIITKKEQPEITVDNIELAQFLYLITLALHKNI